MKRIFALTLALLMAMSLVACGTEKTLMSSRIPIRRAR